MTHDNEAVIDYKNLIPDWLWTWVEWQSNDDAEIRKEVWFRSSTPGLCGGWARGENYWSDQEGEMESSIGAAVDAAIDGLPPGYKAAIQWVTGMQRVAKPRNIEKTFLEALALLEKRVMARHVVV